METILSSKTKTVVISADKPFVIIGERINPTGRKKLAAELAAGDFSRVEERFDYVTFWKRRSSGKIYFLCKEVNDKAGCRCGTLHLA